MNLIQGTLKGGTFTGENVKIMGLDKSLSGEVTLGFRAEDAEITSGGGAITAPVYSMELLGEASMVTMKAGGTIVAIKADKDYSARIGDDISASVPAGICHLFDRATGERLR